MMHIYSGYRPQTSAERIDADFKEAAESLKGGGWMEKPYGSKLDLSETRLANGLSYRVSMLRIEPERSTATKDLDDCGLRGHPGTVRERVRVMECEAGALWYEYRNLADGRSGFVLNVNDNVVYNVRNGIVTRGKRYGEGSVFDSVWPDGKGYWHTITNHSDVQHILIQVNALIRDGRRELPGRRA